MENTKKQTGNKLPVFLPVILSLLLSFLLIFLLSVSLLGGCGSDTAQEADSKVLYLALREGTYADVIRSCLPDFEKQSGYRCEVLALSEDELHRLVSEGGGSGQPLDLVMADSSWTVELLDNESLANLSQYGFYLDNDIIPATTRISYYNDNVYLAPYFGNVTVLLYNKELVKASGHDENSLSTIEDILEVAQYAKSIGKNGFLYRGDTQNNLVVDFLPILLTYGGWVVDQDNHPTVNTDSFAKALACYQELIETGTALPKAELIESIDKGESALAIGWPGWYSPTEDSAAGYCALSGRISEKSISFNANVYGIWMLGVSSASKNPEASVSLIEYLMDPDVQKSTIDQGGVPCRFSSLQDPEVLEQYPHYDAVCKALQGGTYRPAMKDWTTFYTILGDNLKNILEGRTTIERGLSSTQNSLEQALSGITEPQLK